MVAVSLCVASDRPHMPARAVRTRRWRAVPLCFRSGSVLDQQYSAGRDSRLRGCAVDKLLEFVPGFQKLKGDPSLDEAALHEAEGPLRK